MLNGALMVTALLAWATRRPRHFRTASVHGEGGTLTFFWIIRVQNWLIHGDRNMDTVNLQHYKVTWDNGPLQRLSGSIKNMKKTVLPPLTLKA